jgi:hypothetical protein
MNIIKITVVTLIVLLFIACGGGGGSSPVDSNTSDVTLLYNYNIDGTSSIILSPLNVNTFQEITDSLLSVQDNEEEFQNIIDSYISQLFDAYKQIDNLPVYAPRGSNKSTIINVQNQEIDYSHYSLKGDLDNDFKVTLKDIAILKNAFFNKQMSYEYDLNNDGKLDIKDIIDIASHLNEAIYYFDFYSLEGEKLSIATRDVNATKLIAYAGELTQVMLVPKDINHASGFETGLSDIQSVWYKQDLSQLTLTNSEEIEIDSRTGLALTSVNPMSITKESVTARSIDNYNDINYPLYSSSSKLNEKTLGNLIYNKITAESYLDSTSHLLGWDDHVSNIGVSQEYLIQNPLNLESTYLTYLRTPFYEYQKAVYASHFSKISIEPSIFHNDQLAPLLTNYTYHFSIGSHAGNSFYPIVKAYTYNLEYTLKSTLPPELAIPDIKIYFSVTSMIQTDLYMAQEESITGSITNSILNINGKIKAHRVGPDPQEKEFQSNNIEDGIYTFDTFAYGVYKLEYENSCQCSVSLEEEILIDADRPLDIDLDEDLLRVKNLTLTILDKSNNPINDAKVELKPKACVGDMSGDVYEDRSYSDGQVVFHDIFMGDYEVYVDDKYIQDIHFCQDSNQEIHINQLWRLQIDYSAPAFPVSGSVTFKKFTLDCENTIDYGEGFIFCGGVENDFYDSRGVGVVEVSYTSIAYDSGLNPLVIYDGGIEFNALLPLGDILQGGSNAFSGDYAQLATATVDYCNGHFPVDALGVINLGQGVNWTSDSDGGGAVCTFILQPCQDEECNSY